MLPALILLFSIMKRRKVRGCYWLDVYAGFSGLSATHRKTVDELLVPYYTVTHEMEMAENALWVKHASLTAVQVHN